jgi:hypothetical protein
MPDENQPPKRIQHSYRNQYRALPQELKDQIKRDWFTGNYNTIQLAETYKIERERLLAFIRFQWGREAKDRGIKPAKEPPIIRKVYGKVAWDAARMDFLAGIDFPEISLKRGIPRPILEYQSYRKKWRQEREKIYSEGKGILQDRIVSSTAQLALRYEGFMRAAMEQIDVMTEKLRVMSLEGTCTPDRLKTMVDSLSSIVTMGMKIYGMEKPQTQVNNQFIRLDVLDSSASSTMNHLAKTINLKTA